jgi:WD40 repeat protein
VALWRHDELLKRPVASFAAHTGEVTGVQPIMRQWTDDGESVALVTGSRDGTAKLWRWRPNWDNTTTTASASSVVGSSSDGAATRNATGESAASLIADIKAGVVLSVQADDARLYLSCLRGGARTREGLVSVLDVRTLREVSAIGNTDAAAASFRRSILFAKSMQADGDMLMLSQANHATIFDMRNERCVGSMNCGSTIASLAFAGGVGVAGCFDNDIVLWDLRAMRSPFHRFRGAEDADDHTVVVGDVFFDGTKIAASRNSKVFGDYSASVVHLYDARRREPLAAISGAKRLSSPTKLTAVAIDYSSQTLVTCHGDARNASAQQLCGLSFVSLSARK